MRRPLVLLALLFTAACEPAAEKGDPVGEDTGVTEDSGVVDTGPAPEADCSVQGISPLATSWEGGETLTVELLCEDTSLLGEVSLVLAAGEVLVTPGESVETAETVVGAKGLEIVDSTHATASFTSPVQEGTGKRGFSVDMGGTEVPGDTVLRIRKDPGAAIFIKDYDEDGDSLWSRVGLPGNHWTHVAVSHSASKSAAPEGSTTSLLGFEAEACELVFQELSDGEPDAPVVAEGVCPSEGSGRLMTTRVDEVDLSSDGSGELARLAVAAGTGTDSDGDTELFFTVFNGGTGKASTLRFKASKAMSGVGFTWTPPVSGGSPMGDTLPGVVSVDASSWLRSGTLSARLLGTDEKGNFYLADVSLAAKDGSSSLTVTAVAALEAAPVHVSPKVTLAGGAEGTVVFSATSGPVRGVLYTKTLESSTSLSWKTVNSPVAFTSAVADLDKDGVDELLLAAIDGDGNLSTGVATPKDGTITASAPSSWGGGSWSGTGSSASLASLQLRGTDSGSVHLALSTAGWGPRRHNMYREGEFSRPAVTTTVLSWDAGEKGAADLTAPPDHTQMVSLTEARMSGGADAPLPGDLSLLGGLAGGHALLGTLDLDAGPELVLATEAGWELYTQGGAVLARDPDGDVFGEALPLDPTETLTLETRGDELVILGTIVREDAEGAPARSAGVVVLGAEGMGIAAAAPPTTPFHWVWSDSVSTASGELAAGNTLVAVGLDEEGQEVSTLAWISSSAWPAVGDDLDLVPEGFDFDLSLDGESPLAGRPRSVVALAPDRADRTAPDGKELSEDAPLTELATFSSGAKLPDLLLTLPSGDTEGCPLATWFVPGTSADVGSNLAEAVRIATSDREDCADLPIPLLSYHPQGNGDNAVLMGFVSDADDPKSRSTQLYDITWAHGGTRLVALPASSISATITDVGAADVDGDGDDELYLGLFPGADADYGLAGVTSGLVLRRWGDDALASCGFTRDETRLESTDFETTLDVTGTALDDAECPDAFAVTGTAGQRVTASGDDGDHTGRGGGWLTVHVCHL